jgi:hypothetical protein
MPIINFPAKEVYPKQPKIYAFAQNTSTSGVYYTLVNSSGIRGKLSKVGISMSGLSGNTYLNIRITIDGITNTFGNPTSNNSAMGIAHGAYNSSDYDASRSIDYYCDIVFYNSLTVELMQNTGSTPNLVGHVMYSTE